MRTAATSLRKDFASERVVVSPRESFHVSENIQAIESSEWPPQIQHPPLSLCLKYPNKIATMTLIV